MNTGDTITAISSAVGVAARMIVRVSGPQAHQFTSRLCPDSEFEPGTAARTRLRLRGMELPIVLYTFVSPRSYTGEDLVEFHVPGNPLLCRLLLDDLVGAGARLAEAGEFTARAYFNGKMDLTTAEGVAATIAAQGEAQLRAARQLLAGELANRLRPVMELVADTLALVEVGIDFVEEDVTFLSRDEVARRIGEVDQMIRQIVDQSARFERLAHEPRVVLIGRPNAGKSTLLNALAGQDRAVVSQTAGTTRDAVSAEIALRRGMIRLVDVAGLDECEAGGEIDRQMQATARRELDTADLVVLVVDSTNASERPALSRAADLIVFTKADLGQAQAGLTVSAFTGKNLTQLRAELDDLAFGPAAEQSSLALNARHIQALSEARQALARGLHALHAGPELVAMELREGLDALGHVLGSVTPDDLLGRIFSAFCIGK